MIRIITPFLALLCFIATSCSTDIEINDPALQAQIDGEDFRSSIKKAAIFDNGTLVITGSEGDKSVSFTIAAPNKGTYKIGQTLTEVSFQRDDAKFFPQDEEADGEVVITEIVDNEISGQFYFKNLKDGNGNVSNFNNGWFYRLPIVDGVIEEMAEEDINPCLLNASLTAVVDGLPLVTDDHSAVEFGTSNNISSIRITAVNIDSKVEIVFPINVAPGSYSLTGSGDYSATYTWKNDKSSVLNGTLIITQHDLENRCITGTFEYVTRSGIQVTEGVFDYGY